MALGGVVILCGLLSLALGPHTTRLGIDPIGLRGAPILLGLAAIGAPARMAAS